MNGISYRFLCVYVQFLNTKTNFDYCKILILCDFKYTGNVNGWNMKLQS
jgi:hypothetical protein